MSRVPSSPLPSPLYLYISAIADLLLKFRTLKLDDVIGTYESSNSIMMINMYPRLINVLVTLPCPDTLALSSM